MTQEEAARLLGVCERTFRRYIDRFEECGLDGVVDKRLAQTSHREAPVDEVMALCERYWARHDGWTASHFHSWYKRSGGTRSYTWVKTRLQEARLIHKTPRRGAHRKRRERAPWPGMLIHQDSSTHDWAPGQRWDLILTMDDATNEQYSMFFVDEEGTKSSLMCHPQPRRHPLRTARTERRERQLRLLRREKTPDPARPASMPLHQGNGPGPSLPRRHLGDLPWPRKTGKLHRFRGAHPQPPGQGQCVTSAA